jgi:hypothetical protein
MAIPAALEVAKDPGARAAGMGIVATATLLPIMIASIIALIIIIIVIVNNGFTIGSIVAFMIFGALLGGSIWMIKSSSTVSEPPQQYQQQPQYQQQYAPQYQQQQQQRQSYQQRSPYPTQRR